MSWTEALSAVGDLNLSSTNAQTSLGFEGIKYRTRVVLKNKQSAKSTCIMFLIFNVNYSKRKKICVPQRSGGIFVWFFQAKMVSGVESVFHSTLGTL